jgi:hypothetical protein
MNLYTLMKKSNCCCILLQLVAISGKGPKTSVINLFENKQAGISANNYCGSLKDENVNAGMH